MSLKQEHYDLISLVEDKLLSPGALIRTPEKFYEQNPKLYSRDKIKRLIKKGRLGEKDAIRIYSHIVKHLEHKPSIQNELMSRYIEQQFPSPPPAPAPPKPEVQYRRVTMRGYHVPRQRYYTEEKRLIPGFGYRTVSVIHYKKAYDVKPYSYLVET